MNCIQRECERVDNIRFFAFSAYLLFDCKSIVIMRFYLKFNIIVFAKTLILRLCLLHEKRRHLHGILLNIPLTHLCAVFIGIRIITKTLKRKLGLWFISQPISESRITLIYQSLYICMTTYFNFYVFYT